MRPFHALWVPRSGVTTDTFSFPLLKLREKEKELQKLQEEYERMLAAREAALEAQNGHTMDVREDDAKQMEIRLNRLLEERAAKPWWSRSQGSQQREEQLRDQIDKARNPDYALRDGRWVLNKQRPA